MIEVKDVTVYFKGNSIDLLAELCMVMHELLTNTPIEVDDLLDCVKLASMSDDEVGKAYDKHISNLTPAQVEQLKDLMKDSDPSIVNLIDFLGGENNEQK